jgi:hypothetical protein
MTEAEGNTMGSRMESDTSPACESIHYSSYDHSGLIASPRTPGAGSFIRPLPSLQYCGKTFLSALIDKYVEQPRGSDTSETVVLGSSNGAIHVEAVNLDKIRKKFSNLQRLQEISLDKEGVSQADPPGELREKLPSEPFDCSLFPSDDCIVDQDVRGVDLSYSLIPSWDVVAQIAIELPSLERLSLKCVLVLTCLVHASFIASSLATIVYSRRPI